jgi:hypothetical protein
MRVKNRTSPTTTTKGHEITQAATWRARVAARGCIERQKRINDVHFRVEKAKAEEEGREYNARKAKTARNDGDGSV